MNKTIVVNMWGGPSSGKSTTASEVFSRLKKKGVNAEQITEYAKDLTWQESYKVLTNQMYVFAKQHHRMWRVNDKVRVIITDSPLLFSLIYGDTKNPHFEAMVCHEFEKYENINIYLQRPNEYQTHGRTQTLEEARELDERIRTMMNRLGYSFDMDVKVHDDLAAEVAEHVYNVVVRSEAL